MADFDIAIKVVLSDEGGFNNDPDDRGGATNFGISLHLYQSINPQATLKDIHDLTIDMAKSIYYKYFWVKNSYTMIGNQSIATKVFDLAVNMGSHMANIFLQTAINQVLGHRVIADGAIGMQTLFVLNKCANGREEEIYKNIISQATNYYLHLVTENPHLAKFEKGWLNRVQKQV